MVRKVADHEYDMSEEHHDEVLVMNQNRQCFKECKASEMNWWRFLIIDVLYISDSRR